VYDEPVIIIGAGRSGTKMLRNVLCFHPRLITWPCDEINYIWRYGNASYPTDELGEINATPSVCKYIRRKFEKIGNSIPNSIIIEKTCANSLRIPFILKIFPKAKFIFMIRDGRDVVESARRRWKAGIEFKYIFQKSKWIPVVDLPYYGFNFFKNRLYKIYSKENKLKRWGPIFNNLDKYLREKSLIEVCGFQWKVCVEKAEQFFDDFDKNRYLKIKYEELVREPIYNFEKIFSHIGIELDFPLKEKIKNYVTNKNVGKWKKTLSKEDMKKLMPVIHEVLKSENYI